MIIGSFDPATDAFGKQGFTGRILIGPVAFDDIEMCAKDRDGEPDFKVMAHTLVGFICIGAGWWHHKNPRSPIEIIIDFPTLDKPLRATLYTYGYFEGRLIWERDLTFGQKVCRAIRRMFRPPG